MTLFLAGFAADETLASRIALPAEREDLARRLANVPADDPAVAYCYTLGQADAERLAGKELPALDWFLEGDDG